jgi:hypothetical protein
MFGQTLWSMSREEYDRRYADKVDAALKEEFVPLKPRLIGDEPEIDEPIFDEPDYFAITRAFG